MIVTDLMVGDWVEVIQNSEKRFAQVQMIDGYGDNATSHECLCDAIYYSIDELNPIPLTEEILEQNGFVRQDKHEYSVTDSNYNYLKVRCYADTNFEIGNAFDEEGELQAFADIHYVHELQHALKLCGIDKNIEL